MASQFRSTISKNGEFPPEAGRYVLYVCHGCPWAHRATMARKLKGLEEVIQLSVVHYILGEKGWEFKTPEEVSGCTADPVLNAKHISEIYKLSDPNYSGRYTVPVLFDSKTKKIVNNESAEILRIFNTEFNSLAKNPKVDLYPENLRLLIDERNQIVLDGINNGVYKAGFATEQSAYEDGVKLVYNTLQKVEEILEKTPFMCGDAVTETDIRLFATLIRFDPVYFLHFKCNLVSVGQLPNTLKWMERIYRLEGVKETVNMEHIKKLYFLSGKTLNPSGIVPLYDGPIAL